MTAVPQVPARLEAHVRGGPLDLDVALHVEPGEVVALVGPDLAGPSAVLRAVAGLAPVGDGHVHLGEERWEGGGRRRPVATRGLGMVWPDARLLPHLDVVTNVALGLDGGAAGPDAVEAAAPWVDAVGLSTVAGRPARTLGAGQARRAGIARALARTPSVLLLDDPLRDLRGGERAEVRRLLHDVLPALPAPTLLVADPVDAIALADRLVVVADGRMVQEGDVRALTRRPADAWVADHVGTNLYRGQVIDGSFVPAGGEHRLAVVTDVRGPALAEIPPSAVGLFRGRPDGSPRNVWHAGVVAVDGQHGRMRVSLAGRLPIVAEVTPTAAASLELGRGGGIWVVVKATAVRVHAG